MVVHEKHGFLGIFIKRFAKQMITPYDGDASCQLYEKDQRIPLQVSS